MTPAGIEPATFRFVEQHLNHCATAVPPEELHKFVLPESAIIIIIIIIIITIRLKMYSLSFFPQGWGDSVLLILCYDCSTCACTVTENLHCVLQQVTVGREHICLE